MVYTSAKQRILNDPRTKGTTPSEWRNYGSAGSDNHAHTLASLSSAQIDSHIRSKVGACMQSLSEDERQEFGKVLRHLQGQLNILDKVPHCQRLQMIQNARDAIKELERETQELDREANIESYGYRYHPYHWGPGWYRPRRAWRWRRRHFDRWANPFMWYYY